MDPCKTWWVRPRFGARRPRIRRGRLRVRARGHAAPRRLHRGRQADQAGLAGDPRWRRPAVCSCSAIPSAPRSRRSPRASISSTSGPRSSRSRESRGSSDAPDSCRLGGGHRRCPRPGPGTAPADVPGPPYVDHAEWAHWGDLSSLRVYPTDAGRVAAAELGTNAQADEAWAEVLALSPDADIPGMREQFMCHWQLRRARRARQDQLEPRAVAARGRRRRDGRPRLQSRRHRRTVLVPQARSRGAVAAARRPHAAQTRGHRSRCRRRWLHEAAELGVYAVCVSPSMVAIGHVVDAGGSARRLRRRIPVRQAPFGDQGRRGRRWPSRPAPTRSTWSSTSAPRSPVTSTAVRADIAAVRDACPTRSSR